MGSHFNTSQHYCSVIISTSKGLLFIVLIKAILCLQVYYHNNLFCNFVPKKWEKEKGKTVETVTRNYMCGPYWGDLETLRPLSLSIECNHWRAPFSQNFDQTIFFVNIAVVDLLFSTQFLEKICVFYVFLDNPDVPNIICRQSRHWVQCWCGWARARAESAYYGRDKR